MTALNPYLNFNGETEAAFNFYKSVFGGEFTTLQRFKDAPDGHKLEPDAQHAIMHVGLPIGKHTILMGSDAPESMGFKLNMGNNVILEVEVESKHAADELYKKLGHGGIATMPLTDMFWGSYFGTLTDKFGVNWMINYTPPKK